MFLGVCFYITGFLRVNPKYMLLEIDFLGVWETAVPPKVVFCKFYKVTLVFFCDLLANTQWTVLALTCSHGSFTLFSREAFYESAHPHTRIRVLEAPTSFQNPAIQWSL